MFKNLIYKNINAEKRNYPNTTKAIGKPYIYMYKPYTHTIFTYNINTLLTI